MPPTTRPPAKTYDEIVRGTVPEPDSSFRPTPEQVKAAYEGARILSDDEQQLHDRVAAVLSQVTGFESAAIVLEIDDTRVELRGRARDMRMIDELEQRAAGVDGVTAVDNRLVVDSDALPG